MDGWGVDEGSKLGEFLRGVRRGVQRLGGSEW